MPTSDEESNINQQEEKKKIMETAMNVNDASSLVVASKVEKIRLIIVRAEDQSTKTFVDVLRQNDLNINFNRIDE